MLEERRFGQRWGYQGVGVGYGKSEIQVEMPNGQLHVQIWGLRGKIRLDTMI